MPAKWGVQLRPLSKRCRQKFDLHLQFILFLIAFAHRWEYACGIACLSWKVLPAWLLALTVYVCTSIHISFFGHMQIYKSISSQSNLDALERLKMFYPKTPITPPLLCEESALPRPTNSIGAYNACMLLAWLTYLLIMFTVQIMSD